MNSEHTHTIAEPTDCRCFTKQIFNKRPTDAPNIELVNIALSFFKGISICMIIICSYPIMRISGMTILIGMIAPS